MASKAMESLHGLELMRLLSGIRKSYLHEDYKQHYNGNFRFDEQFMKLPFTDEADKQLVRHHHRQVCKDRITYHRLRSSGRSHSDTVAFMEAKASSRPPDVRAMMDGARQLAAAILETVSEPEPDSLLFGYQAFSEQAITYYRAFLAASKHREFQDERHRLNFFNAARASGMIRVFKLRPTNERLVGGDGVEAMRIGNLLVEEEEAEKTAKDRRTAAAAASSASSHAAASSSAASSASVSSSASAAAEEDRDFECVACMEHRPYITTMPCMHRVLCDACFKEVIDRSMQCPMCRGDITAWLPRN